MSDRFLYLLDGREAINIRYAWMVHRASDPDEDLWMIIFRIEDKTYPAFFDSPEERDKEFDRIMRTYGMNRF